MAALPESFTSPQVRIVRSHILGEVVTFAIDQPRDTIQSHHLAGRFYEPDELMIMSKVFPVGGRFLDIGANVGNHSVFFGKIMKAQHILPIEVNPRVLEILKTNIVLNGLEEVCDMTHLGVGFHDARVDDAAIGFRERNIGGAKLSYDGGDLRLVKGDDVVKSPFDLVKIDVEGAEIKVLKGLQEFVDKHRPHFFIEVENQNADAFENWMAANRYAPIDRFKRYRANENYLISPT